jgi:hypothetical protein
LKLVTVVLLQLVLLLMVLVGMGFASGGCAASGGGNVADISVGCRPNVVTDERRVVANDNGARAFAGV